jgi:spore maturation protein CgeB
LDFLNNATDVVSYYGNSKISLNIFRTARWPGENVLHIDPGKAYSLSPRCYEIMACGGFLLTDSRPELFELFEVGKDLVVFDGAEDLADKVRYYLSHERDRKKIAMSGLMAVKDHTYDKRAKQIVDFVSSL